MQDSTLFSRLADELYPASFDAPTDKGGILHEMAQALVDGHVASLDEEHLLINTMNTMRLRACDDFTIDDRLVSALGVAFAYGDLSGLHGLGFEASAS